MRLINVCPECGNQLIKRSLRCSCGWVLVNNRDNNSTDFQCHFWLAKERCKENGVICQTNGSGQWYCSQHWYHADSSIDKF